MSEDLIKTAAVAIRQLKDEKLEVVEEIEKLAQEFEHHKKATALALRLFTDGSVAAEDLVNAIEDFNEQTDEELNVIEKAAELSRKAGEPLLFGRLSDQLQDDGLSAEDRFIAGLME